MLSKTELALLKQCILNNPRNTMYVSGKEANIVVVNNSKKMQQIFISKLPIILTCPNSLTVDEYTNLRLYVNDEFLNSGWDNEKNCPTNYGLQIDRLLNKLSSLADSSEKNS